MKNNAEVDKYIAAFPEEVQQILQELRKTVKNAAPEAEEIMNYGIPTLSLHGNLVHFAAFKNHIGFYPAPSGLEAFREELAGYKGAKGSVQFPIDKPLPFDIVSRITKFRVDENLAKTEAKDKKPIKSDSKIKKEQPVQTKKLSDEEQVSAHIQKLEPELAKVIEVIRQIILTTDQEIGEQIKWNNPSFYYTGEMKPFDPKEYKRDMVVMNLHKGRIMLVFPSGAKVNDKTGFLEGDYKDGRKTVAFKDLEDVISKEKSLQNVLKEWLQLVEKE